MSQINLLPTEILQSKEVQKIGTGLKVLAAVFGTLCLAIALGGTAFIFYKNKSVETLQAKEIDLKSQVSALENSEQTLVLLRDRLNKLKTITDKYPNNDTFTNYKNTFDRFPVSVALSRLDMTSGVPEFSLTAPDSDSLAAALQVLASSSLSGDTIKNLSYNSVSGFQFSFVGQ